MMKTSKSIGGSFERGASFTNGSDVPLYVDLDGTLIRTDMLWETLLVAIRVAPWILVLIPFWLLRGRAYLKHRLAILAHIEPESLPYNLVLLKYLRCQQKAGRPIYLATASNIGIAQAVARHLQLFGAVIASDENANKSGSAKLDAIREHARCASFAYAGNSWDDWPLFKAADHVILVNTSSRLKKEVLAKCRVAGSFMDRQERFRALVETMRPHQWAKNILLFIPMLTSHYWADFSRVLALGKAFLSFSLMASCVYFINDMLDTQSDRTHPTKCKRAFASGRLSYSHGVGFAAALAAIAALLAINVSTHFALALLLYLALTVIYSVWLKRVVLLDVLMLATLYTLRVIAGASVIQVTLTFWLLAFSVLLFFGLATLKRCAELSILQQKGITASAGRDYQVVDMGVLKMMGLASCYLAVLVSGLYFNSPDVSRLYMSPHALWFVCPLLLYWVSRMWLLSDRGQMNEDPVLFAVRDKCSLAIMFMIGVLVVAAAKGLV